MNRVVVGLVLAFMLSNVAAAGAEVDEYLGKTIVSIRIDAEGREVTDPRVLQLIETKAGSPLSMRSVRDTIVHLIALGLYEDVQVRAASVAQGVALVYDLVLIHAIDSISFTGTIDQPGIDTGRLRRAVTERYGSSPSAARAEDLTGLVEDLLRERGYLHATVTARVEREHSPHRATLVFAIASGPRTLIGDVTVTGNPGVPVPQLLDRLDIATGEPFEREALNARLEEYRQSRRSNGFVEAKLSVATRFEQEDRVVHLALTADQGPKVHVVFKGDTLPGKKQREFVPIVEEGSADQDLLEDSSRRIEDYLRALGYREAKAPYAREEMNGELTVSFSVTRGPLYHVGELGVTGAAFLSEADIEARLHVKRGQTFSEPQLEADLTALESFYRVEGYASARVRFSVELLPAGAAEPGAVSIRVLIAEGVRTIVTGVRVEGNTVLSEAELHDGVGLRAGRPFFLTQMAVDRDTIQVKYANRGFQNAVVRANPGISVNGSRADVVFTVVEGSQLFVDHILVVGNTRTKTATIERALRIKSGDPLGIGALLESQQSLAELGLFRRTKITQVEHSDDTKRDVLVAVEEAPVTTIGFGGGVEAGPRTHRTAEQGGAAIASVEFAPRAFFEIGRRNLFDKNRSINLFTRVSLRPKDSPFFGDQVGSATGVGGYGFSEYRILGTYREPRVLGTSADAFLSGTIEQQVRSSFNFSRRAFSTDIGRVLSPRVSVSGNYQIQRTELFNQKINPADKLLVDRLFPQVLLSSFSASAADNTRDDVVEPHSGHYLSVNGQVAAQAIGSEVGFLKSYLTAQHFHAVPRARGLVLATSARLGMAYGLPRPVTATEDNNEILQNPVTVIVKDLPASERFFAGGDTTVRGFSLDSLGTSETLDKNGFAIGGNALLVLNAELRMPLHGSVGIVGFFDAGNVFSRTTALDLGELRSAAGFGLRYRSPVGPLRVDLGFKLQRRDIVPGVREKPTALHISLGQAF